MFDHVAERLRIGPQVREKLITIGHLLGSWTAASEATSQTSPSSSVSSASSAPSHSPERVAATAHM
jgi:hypothetical protein